MQLLLQSRPNIRVVEAVANDEELTTVSDRETLQGVVLELEGVPWDVTALVKRLRRRHGALRIVGTVAGEVGPQVEGVATTRSRSASSQVIVDALVGKGKESPYSPPLRSEAVPHRAGTLTSREFQVLALIGGGLTTSQIADRLGISSKTVEGKRQSLFTKLGVQNQSAAVSIAIRTGLLGPQAPNPTSSSRS
jgi:DNA-binding CsgD family transcriptional regulator